MGSIMSDLDYSSMGFAQMKQRSRVKKVAVPDTSNVEETKIRQIRRNEMAEFNLDDIGWDDIEGDEASGTEKNELFIKIKIDGSVKFGIATLEAMGYRSVYTPATAQMVTEHKETPESKERDRNTDKLKYPMEIGHRHYKVKNNGSKDYTKKWLYYDNATIFDEIGVSKTKVSSTGLSFLVLPAASNTVIASKITPKNRSCKLSGQCGEHIQQVIRDWYDETTVMKTPKSGDPTGGKEVTNRISKVMGIAQERVYKVDPDSGAPKVLILDEKGKKILVVDKGEEHPASSGVWSEEGLIVEENKPYATLVLDKVKMIYEMPPTTKQ